MKEKSIHIGKRIKEEMERQGRRTTWLAERLHYDRSNIYHLYERKSIDTDLLLTISRLLGVNFFEQYSSLVTCVDEKKSTD